MATPSKAKVTVKVKADVKPKQEPANTAPPKKASAKPAVPSTEFHLYAPEADEVLLAGDFCDWQGEKCRMRRFKDGHWKKSLKLKPGRYEYRFVVDGHWWSDPANPQRQENPFGQENSVIHVD